MSLKFWSGMNPRVGLKLADKLMVGNIDNGEPEHISIDDLATLIGQAGASGSLRKNGYRWIKGDGNVSLTNYEEGDEIIGEGTLYPGFVIHGYIKATPTATPDDYITLLSSVKL